jgi:hypothetical protein
MMAMTTRSSTNVNARRDLMLYRTALMEIRFKLYFFDGAVPPIECSLDLNQGPSRPIFCLFDRRLRPIGDFHC